MPATTVSASRRCGRCRQEFPLDPDTDPLTVVDWWVCGPCHAILLPNRAS
jgi:hypothetical protein